MTNTEYAKLNIEIVINIRKLAELHLKNNPEMSSGTVVELLMEGIEEDVFDGWDPDANKQDINMKETLTDIITVLTIVGSVIIVGTFIGGYVIGLMLF